METATLSGSKEADPERLGGWVLLIRPIPAQELDEDKRT